MKIRQELLRIATGATHADGTKAEPEEQPIERRIIAESDTAMMNGEKTASNIPVHFVSETNVATMAKKLTAPCSTCKFFDRKEFRKMLAIVEAPGGPMHLKEEVNNIRASLLMSSNANLNEQHSGLEGDMDVEHALNAMGFCRALTEASSDPTDPIVVHPSGCCPAEVITESQPMGFYSPKDSIAKKQNVSTYDAILKQAQGKLP